MTGELYLLDQKIERHSFQDQVLRLATVLKELGVAEDDAVGALLYNDPFYIAVVEACRHVGAHYVPLNWHGSAMEIADILDDSHTKVLIGHSTLTSVFQGEFQLDFPILSVEIPAAVQEAYSVEHVINEGQVDAKEAIESATPIATPPPRTRGMMSYTSGSTGRPKGIRRQLNTDRPDSYDTYKALAESLLQLTPGDRFYTSAPLYHSAPNALSVMCVAYGNADLILSPRFDAEQFLADIERFKITHVYMVPAMMVRLLKLPEPIKAKYDTSSWRFSITTGSAWPRDIKQAMIDWFGPIFYETYGASEIGFMTLISSDESLRKPGSAGKVLPGGSIKIIDDNNNQLPAGETGSIYVYLPMFGDFSYSNLEGNLEGIRYGDHTTVGDLGHLDEEGYLYISDRKKDMIISGGANIFPAEIESVLIEMPEIVDCAVFGVPHPEFGESVVAAVELAAGKTVNQESVAAFLDGKIARFKIPRVIETHDRLPREDSGKIFKQRLRAPHWADQKGQI